MQREPANGASIMNHILFRSKFLAYLVLFLFIMLLYADTNQRSSVEQNEVKELIQAGKKFYESKEYERAIIEFLEALLQAKTNDELSEIYFYLSLSYFAIDENQRCVRKLKKLFEIQPDMSISDQYFPSGFVSLFNQTKNESILSQALKPEEKEAKAEKQSEKEKKPVAIGKESETKKKGKFPWLIVVGGAVVAGIILAVILKKKEKPTTSTSSIIVTTSTPSTTTTTGTTSSTSTSTGPTSSVTTTSIFSTISSTSTTTGPTSSSTSSSSTSTSSTSTIAPYANTVHPNFSVSSGPTNTEVTFYVYIDENNSTINSFGLDVTYPTNLFSYHGCTKSSLTSNWANVDCNEVSSGKIRIGGYVGGGTPISPGSKGNIAALTFKVTCSGCPNGYSAQTCISAFVDDLAAMNGSGSCATFTFQSTLLAFQK